jgi:hypothetical protein
VKPSSPKSKPISDPQAAVGPEELSLHASDAGLQVCTAWFHHLDQARRAELSMLQHWTEDLQQAAKTMAKTSEPLELVGMQAGLIGASLAHAVKLNSELIESWQVLQAAWLEDLQVIGQMDQLLAPSAGGSNIFKSSAAPEQTLKWMETVWASGEQLTLGWAAMLQPQVIQPHVRTPA